MQTGLSPLWQTASVLVPSRTPATDVSPTTEDRSQRPPPIGPVASISTSQMATILKGMLEVSDTSSNKNGGPSPAERTLKPYGVGMLPKGPTEDAIEDEVEKVTALDDSREDRAQDAEPVDQPGSNLPAATNTALPQRDSSTSDGTFQADVASFPQPKLDV